MEGAGIITELKWHLLELIRDDQTDSETAEAVRDQIDRLEEERQGETPQRHE